MRQFHIYSTLLALTALLTACNGSPLDEPETTTAPSTAARIEIIGGKPSGFSLSRANEPAQIGYCNADRLRIYVFRGDDSYLTLTPSTTNHTVETNEEVDIINYCGNYNTDRWTHFTYDFDVTGSRRTGYALPAIAYNKEDEDLFYTNAHITGTTFATHKLTLNKEKTPELFFGHLSAVDGVAQTGGAFYFHNSATSAKTFSKPIEGKIYRLVSQLNLKISNINPKIVEKIELYVSKIPSAVGLHGTHGTFYPITALGDTLVPGDNQTYFADSKTDEKFILIDSAENFADGKCTLSTFLLPSTLGRRIKAKVTYTPEAFHTKEKVIREYNIKPSRSAYLKGEDAQVYGSNAPLYVYNGVDDLFFSYANVRVNLTGKFEDYFAETGKAEVVIEVCPTFETSHNIPIKE